jgi:hypothetical protein
MPTDSGSSIRHSLAPWASTSGAARSRRRKMRAEHNQEKSANEKGKQMNRTIKLGHAVMAVVMIIVLVGAVAPERDHTLLGWTIFLFFIWAVLAWLFFAEPSREEELDFERRQRLYEESKPEWARRKGIAVPVEEERTSRASGPTRAEKTGSKDPELVRRNPGDKVGSSSPTGEDIRAKLIAEWSKDPEWVRRNPGVK